MKKSVLICALVMLCTSGLFAQRVRTVFNGYEISDGDTSQGVEAPEDATVALIDVIFTKSAAPENNTALYISHSASAEAMNIGAAGRVDLDTVTFLTADGPSHYVLVELESINIGYLQFFLDASASPSDTSLLDVNVRFLTR